MTSNIYIAGHDIGSTDNCFIIAEAGVNHNGDLGLAKRLIEVAADAGANAVKFQTFTAERLATRNAPKAGYQITTTDSSESQYDMLRRLELSTDAHRILFEYSQEVGILFMSSPFDEESSDFLNELGVEAFKIPSGEITNLSYLSHVGAHGKPMVISTGMANLIEVEQAVHTVRQAGNEQIVLLHCVSNYPADPATANLRAMDTMKDTFGLPVGYSDHTLGITIPFAAVALGACVIEKHFTLDRTLSGPDHLASLGPLELANMVRGIRTVETALGTGDKSPSPTEYETAAVARKSLVTSRTIPKGVKLTAEDLIARRPGTGLSPAMLPSIIGRKTRVSITAGELIALEMLY